MYKYKVDKYKTKYFKLVGGLNLDNLPLNNSTNTRGPVPTQLQERPNLDNLPLNNSTNTRGPVPTQQENAINNLYQLRRNNV